MAEEDLQALKNKAHSLRQKLEKLEEEIECAQLKEIARYSWVYTEADDYKYLHSASVLPPDIHNWSLGPGVLDCGLEVEDARIPGIASRTVVPRCQKCCDSQGIPSGDGSPKNDQACRVILALNNTKDEPHE